MSVFVDSSLLIAMQDEDDARAATASALWRDTASRGESLVTSNYVVVEAAAVAQRRWGLPAVHRLLGDVLAPVAVEWVSADDHERAVNALLLAGRRDLSLVDCTSFELMRRLGIRECLAFDSHFAEQGFRVLGA
jgi:uncharacterized protein